ncbi:putative pyroglutamyl peptidase type I [Xylariaceae sp. FL0594]|nr:putative pyroglutamyl peptidase type I [Xylariaceae sp. FL0594]
MGSVEIDGKELAVLVTGFGPFREEYPVNPSWEIASRLPAYLPADRAKDVAARRSAAADIAPLPPVRIHKLGPVRVNYEVVRGLVPGIWDGGIQVAEKNVAAGESQSENDDGVGSEGGGGGGYGDDKYDFVIHIGMAGEEPHYDIERRGHRDGYFLRDVDDELLGDEARQEKEGKNWIWHDVPKELQTDLDINDVHRRWVERSPSALDLRVSEDAGRYLCDFIYFSSLAHLYKQGRERKVVFFHVPAFPDEASVQLGVELALNLIRSIAESELERMREKKKQSSTV